MSAQRSSRMLITAEAGFVRLSRSWKMNSRREHAVHEFHSDPRGGGREN